MPAAAKLFDHGCSWSCLALGYTGAQCLAFMHGFYHSKSPYAARSNLNSLNANGFSCTILSFDGFDHGKIVSTPHESKILHTVVRWSAVEYRRGVLVFETHGSQNYWGILAVLKARHICTYVPLFHLHDLILHVGFLMLHQLLNN